MATRTTGAIALQSSGNAQGGYHFFSLTTCLEVFLFMSSGQALHSTVVSRSLPKRYWSHLSLWWNHWWTRRHSEIDQRAILSRVWLWHRHQKSKPKVRNNTLQLPFYLVLTVQDMARYSKTWRMATFNKRNHFLPQYLKASISLLIGSRIPVILSELLVQQQVQ